MKKALQRLDAIHQKLLKLVSSLDENVYSHRPSENEWSVGEIVHHLCLVEARVIQELEKALTQEPRRLGLLRRMIPTSIVSVRFVRVRAPKAVTPLEAPPRAPALEAFERTRNHLKTLCATHGEERFRNLVFKHPFLGEIEGVATVSFVGHHERRHYKQIRDVLRKLSNDPAKTN
jgi:uncharacterized damage-inducible protein DinB